MSRSKKVPETIDGQILAIPRAVKRSDAYKACSPFARALLVELADQHNGSNNGRLNLSYAHLKEQGFKSKDQISKGRDELIARNLIVLTRQGGLPIRNGGKTTFSGASWFALTWHRISNFVGLDIVSAQYQQGVWRTPCEIRNREQPKALREARLNRSSQPVKRDSPDPCHGAGEGYAVPCHGSLGGGSDQQPAPYSGNNVIHHALYKKGRRLLS